MRSGIRKVENQRGEGGRFTVYEITEYPASTLHTLTNRYSDPPPSDPKPTWRFLSTYSTLDHYKKNSPEISYRFCVGKLTIQRLPTVAHTLPRDRQGNAKQSASTGIALSSWGLGYAMDDPGLRSWQGLFGGVMLSGRNTSHWLDVTAWSRTSGDIPPHPYAPMVFTRTALP